MTAPVTKLPKLLKAVTVPASWREADRLLKLARESSDRAGVCAAMQDGAGAGHWLGMARLFARHAAECLEDAAVTVSS